MKPVRNFSDFKVSETLKSHGVTIVMPVPDSSDVVDTHASPDDQVKFDKNTLTWKLPGSDGFVCPIFRPDEVSEDQ